MPRDTEIEDGDLVISKRGKGIKISEGSNCPTGTGTLVAGVLLVANTLVTANSRIFLQSKVLGTVTSPKTLGVTARVAGTSFTVTSADATDTSTFDYMIINQPQGVMGTT
jgi:hypothetical protein